jgi:hypothetical protein
MSVNNRVESMKKKILYLLFLHFVKTENGREYLSLYSKPPGIQERKDGIDERVYKGGTEKEGKKNVEIN